MGLIRKGLYLGTGGVVAPHSRKQRTVLKTLAAIQGATPSQVRHTGGRYDFTSVITGTPDVPQARPAVTRTPEQIARARARQERRAARKAARKAAREAQGGYDVLGFSRSQNWGNDHE